MRWWLVGTLALGCGCSPYGGGSFACTQDTQCTPNGVCSSGFCAFPDMDCSSGFRFGTHSGPSSGDCVGATNPDGSMPDMDTTPTPDGAVCYGSSIVHPCFANAPTGTLTFSNTLINTDTSTMCAPLVGANANAWCVIAGSSITIPNNSFLAANGSRPLVLVSTGTIDIQGLVSVASTRQFANIGAGGDAAGCNAGTAPTVSSGGAGGSFGGTGGNGAAAGGGTAGTAGAPLTVTALRGGCPGQKGAGGGGGAAGHGGGAVWLYAATSIAGAGTINASGSSGINADSASSSGGGGGGAGGFIGLESPSITLTGNVFANGGAGGGASGVGSTGGPGTDSTGPTTAAVGGAAGSVAASAGGNGSVGQTLNGSPGVPGSGLTAGGGGGGGAGIIKVIGGTLNTSVSPPPS